MTSELGFTSPREVGAPSRTRHMQTLRLTTAPVGVPPKKSGGPEKLAASDPERCRVEDAGRPSHYRCSLSSRSSAKIGSIPQPLHQAMNSVTSTRRFPDSQLKIQDCGLRSLRPSSRCVRLASSRTSRRNLGSARYAGACWAFAMQADYVTKSA